MSINTDYSVANIKLGIFLSCFSNILDCLEAFVIYLIVCSIYFLIFIKQITCLNILLGYSSLYWRRKWQPTPVFLPGESQGRQSLVGCHLWGRTESDTTEAT